MVKSLDIAVLLVNGKNSEYKGIPWVAICLRELARFKTLETVKLFLWNHDMRSPKVAFLADQHVEWVECYTERSYAVDDINSPKRRWRDGSPLGWRKMHAHRTPLQILYQIATGAYDPKIIVTFDTDSWPVRKGWDRMFLKALQKHKLAGVWRNELVPSVQPFVHPSGLAISTKTILTEKLRFDEWPANQGEDTVSHFSRKIHKKWGTSAIAKFKRSNKVNYHPVAGGVYADWIYHHHMGTRFTAGLPPIFKGSKERGETTEQNKKIITEMTERVFFDYDNYIAELRGVKQ